MVKTRRLIGYDIKGRARNHVRTHALFTKISRLPPVSSSTCFLQAAMLLESVTSSGKTTMPDPASSWRISGRRAVAMTVHPLH